MKKLISIITVTFILFVIASFSIPKETNLYQDYLITHKKVGGIHIGMSFTDLYNLYGKENIKKDYEMYEGESYDVYNVHVNGSQKPTFEIFPDCKEECFVQNISVYDSKYKTKENIGVGNTYKDLRSKYYTKLIIGLDGINGIGYYSKKYGSDIIFVLSTEGLKEGVWGLPAEELEEWDLSENQKIISIIVR